MHLFLPLPRAVGEITLATVYNSLENAGARGKPRPVVLIAREAGHWVTMGLTTNPTYRSGLSRTPIPNPGSVGLRRPTYLWSERLTNVSCIDLDHRIGFTDTALAEAIIQVARLQGHWAHDLRTAATGQ